MTKIELQILKNQVVLMHMVHALSHMWSADKAELIGKIMKPSLDATVDLIEEATR